MSISHALVTLFLGTIVVQFVIRTAVDLYLEIKGKMSDEKTKH